MAADTSSEEFTVSQLVERLWRRRGLLVAVPLLFVIAAAAGLAIFAASNRTPVVYYIGLNGLENSRYPNGAAFSPSDLTIPDVLTVVASSFGIADVNDLRRAVSVRYGSPVEAGLTEKYRNRLAAATLASMEIDGISEDYIDELEKLVRSGLRLELDYQSLGLDRETGISVIAAIPKVWSDIYPRLFNVLRDTRLADISARGDVADLTDTRSLLLADTTLKTMSRGLQIVSEDTRLSAATTDDGATAADLVDALRRYRIGLFEPLFYSRIDSDGIAIRSLIRQHRSTLTKLNRQLQGLDKNVDDLRGMGRPASTSDSIAGTGVQLGDGALNQIVGLSRQAALVDYLKEVLENRSKLVMAISEVEQDLVDLTNPIPAGDGFDATEAATADYRSLVTRYGQLLSAARARIGSFVGQLYTPSQSPQVLGSVIPTRSVIVLVLSLLVGLFAGTLAALVLPGRRRANAGAAS